MAKSEVGGVAPTMIIPSGTEIEVDSRGQLSVKTPGNLVIQHSGNYGTIESESGSIRIESNAEVEAVTVRCAETCYVQGSLTAWRVEAKAIHLEESARANVVLQETQRMQIGRDARLVGNFQSEKELFVLFSRFANQFRALPFFGDREGGGELSAGEAERLIESSFESLAEGGELKTISTEDGDAGQDGSEPPTGDEPAKAPKQKKEKASASSDGASTASPTAPRPGELPDSLFFSRILLEREFNRGSYGPTSKRVIEELIKLLTDRELDSLRSSYTSLFSRIVEPGHDLKRARDLMADFFSGKTGEI